MKDFLQESLVRTLNTEVILLRFPERNPWIIWEEKYGANFRDISNETHGGITEEISERFPNGIFR